MSWVASAPWRFVGWGSVFGCLLGKRSEAEGPTHAAVQCTQRKAPSIPWRDAASHAETPRGHWSALGRGRRLSRAVVNVLASIFIS